MPDRASPGWQRPDKQAAHTAPPFPGSVIELPDSAAFINVLTDSSFIAAAVVAITAGVVRGFSGFGAALIYVPLTASIYTPQVAVASFVLIDFICIVPYAVRAIPKCHGRELFPAYAAAFALVPLGTLAQVDAEPDRAAMGHGGAGAGVRRAACERLALSVQAEHTGGARRRRDLRLLRRRRAALRSAAADLLAGQPDERRARARQHDGLPDADRAHHVGHLRLARADGREADRTRGVGVAGLYPGIVAGRAAVPRRVRSDLPPHRLCDRGDCRAGQPAAVRQILH